MTSWPPVASLLAINHALEFIDPAICYTTPQGNVFHMAGPQAPISGAENGLVLSKDSIRGLQAPIKHLTSQGARQDGDTWNDAVYDAQELDFVVELCGVTPLDTQKVVRAWVDGWDPKKLGKLSVFSPTTGEWWVDCRQGKNIPDALAHFRSGGQKFTWTAVNNDAFWKSFDSVGSFKVSYDSASYDWTLLADGALDTSKWNISYTQPTGHGSVAVSHGAAQWIQGGNTANEVICRYVGTGALSATDNQVVSIQLTGPEAFDLFDGGYADVWARLDTSDNGIRMRLGFGDVKVSYFHNGTETVIGYSPIFPPLWNETFTLVAGTNDSPYNFQVQRDGFTIRQFIDYNKVSAVGSSNRGWGFGFHAGAATFGGQDVPSGIRLWKAGDNLAVTQKGFIPITNIGDQDGWVRHLCYGPGTFTFSNGPGADTSISFGPILDGQVVMINTLPRLRGVVDLSPAQPPQQLDSFQELIKDLIDFATNNNTPPLLQQFESFFGILPPQGNLYSLLNGRFTAPVPPKPESEPPVTSHIAVGITGGGPNSKIVTALTPYRKWPL